MTESDREPTTAVELERLARSRLDVPEALAQVLDDLRHGWALLWLQRELIRLGSPEGHDRAAGAEPQRRYVAEQARRLRALVDPGPEGGATVHGWSCDAERGLLRLPPDPRQGSRPGYLLHDLVRRLYVVLDDSGRNLKPTRKRIADLLRPYFPPGELDTRKDHPIHRSIKRYL